jgi:hypothetical protein
VRVELVEMLVRGLGDHKRSLSARAVAVRSLERCLFRRRLGGGEVQSLAGGVALQRVLVLPVAEAALIALVVGVERSEVGGELGA